MGRNFGDFLLLSWRKEPFYSGIVSLWQAFASVEQVLFFLTLKAPITIAAEDIHKYFYAPEGTSVAY